jgi:hypothetical protein
VENLLTKARLNRFNSSVDPNCCLCNNGLEDINHLFCSCDFAREIWKLFPDYSPNNANEVDIIDWIKTNISSNNPNIISALEKCFLLFWQIWDSRN